MQDSRTRGSQPVGMSACLIDPRLMSVGMQTCTGASPALIKCGVEQCVGRGSQSDVVEIEWLRIETDGLDHADDDVGREVGLKRGIRVTRLAR